MNADILKASSHVSSMYIDKTQSIVCNKTCDDTTVYQQFKPHLYASRSVLRNLEFSLSNIC
uniref:Uncharacterized protein n=1 Tax=Arion vulgaris TaxID=1028688 RepID=A0A0B6Y7R5_9EUPU